MFSSGTSTEPASVTPLHRDTGEWCLGLPFERQRPLEPEEKESLKRETSLKRKLCHIVLCVLPLLLILPIISIAYMDGSVGKAFSPARTLSAILLVALILPIGILFSRAGDAAKWRKGLKKDLAANEVRQFCGPIGAYEGPMPTHFSGSDVLIEVLPHSHLLWKVNGERVSPWQHVTISEAAAIPEASGRVAAWVEPIVPQQGMPLTPEQKGRRDLSHTEMKELATRRLQLWLRPMVFAIFLNVLLELTLGVFLVNHTPVRLERSGYVLIALTLFCDCLVLRNLWIARQLWRDQRHKYVTIVRVATSGLAHLAEGDVSQSLRPEQANHDATHILEILPISQMVWTSNGQPAMWRHKV